MACILSTLLKNSHISNVTLNQLLMMYGTDFSVISMEFHSQIAFEIQRTLLVNDIISFAYQRLFPERTKLNRTFYSLLCHRLTGIRRFPCRQHHSKSAWEKIKRERERIFVVIIEMQITVSTILKYNSCWLVFKSVEAYYKLQAHHLSMLFIWILSDYALIWTFTANVSWILSRKISFNVVLNQIMRKRSKIPKWLMKAPSFWRLIFHDSIINGEYLYIY